MIKKKSINLHKSLGMGMNPVVSAPAVGATPMMKKGGKVHKKGGGEVCMKAGGAVSKHKGTKHGHHHMRSSGVHKMHHGVKPHKK